MDRDPEPSDGWPAELQPHLDRVPGRVRNAAGRVLARVGAHSPDDALRPVRTVDRVENAGRPDGGGAVHVGDSGRRGPGLPADGGKLRVRKRRPDHGV